MKKIVLAMTFGMFCLAYSLDRTAMDTPLASGILTEVEHEFRTGMTEVEVRLERFYDLSEKFKRGESSLDDLKSELQGVRLAYKGIEYLFEYLDPELAVTYVNGAPLPKLEKHIPQVVLIEPNGLQTLDELVWLEGTEAADDIIKLSGDLLSIWKKANVLMSEKRLQHRYVIEAIRYGVVRVFSLGVTGFDTPGSANAMTESRASWEVLSETFVKYSVLVDGRNKDNFETCRDLFRRGEQILISTDDFTEFDHLTFIREIVNPLYRQLLYFQKATQIELNSDVDPTLSAHEYESESIFSEKFFNASYYTQIAGSDLYDPLKVDLGKKLFFDPALSRELNMSCATCHDPKQGFTDGLPKSRTNEDGVFTDRHAPTLLNSALYGRYFWDLREYDLERQIKHVVHNNLEFDMDFVELTERLKDSEEYLELFTEAYGDRDKYRISVWSISNSLAAYITSLTSFRSEFDRYVNGEVSSLDDEVKRGYNLFMGKGACATCHFAPTFSGLVPPFFQDSESEVLGVTTAFDTIDPVLDPDPGRRYNGLPEEEAEHYMHSFKTVTVRNADITGPYFHNGAFETLEEVLIFYNKGGGAGLGVDIDNQTLPSDPLDLTQEEMEDIVAFMRSLTDTVGMTAPPENLPKFVGHPEWDDRLGSY